MSEKITLKLSDVLRGIYGGIIGSLCCVLPLVAVAAGLGFIPGIMTAPRYRIYFVILGLLVVIFLTWRRLSRSKLDNLQKFSIAAITLTSFLLVVTIFTYLVTPAVSHLIANNSSNHTSLDSKKSAVSARVPGELHQLTLKITGLTCPSCSSVVEGLVSKINGVRKVKVDAVSGEGKVIYNTNLVSKEKIAKAVEGQGATKTAYKAKIVKDEKYIRHLKN